jgi:glutamate synthase domain-containing protein 2
VGNCRLSKVTDQIAAVRHTMPGCGVDLPQQQP